MDKLAREDHTVVISCELGLKIWEELDLVKVYTKKRGAHPDLDDPSVCNGIHRSLATNFRYALVWVSAQ
ncbi:hypothetical protein C8Q77DRAFT_1151674 [Trametes polyzona]|nr:hypothetical protein C8Q77DRAFT_1151674 [Trametes polyzona]